MRRRRRVEVTVETSQLVVRRGLGQIPGWCVDCSALVQTITLGEAATLAGVSTSTVYRRAEAGRLHFVETAQSPLICLNSLLRPTGAEPMIMMQHSIQPTATNTTSHQTAKKVTAFILIKEILNRYLRR